MFFFALFMLQYQKVYFLTNLSYDGTRLVCKSCSIYTVDNANQHYKGIFDKNKFTKNNLSSRQIVVGQSTHRMKLWVSLNVVSVYISLNVMAHAYVGDDVYSKLRLWNSIIVDH